ncbi:hypothetical protein PX699_00130 [Sphingobium sp. H39-3-25]|uniref:hypothetical protein n=1 Tax=Sphingobium arseniciresistens TaxID=3030834 RepID=UPI0023BA28CA|nr:hypothetical protein [Sphingobium arseniciresistens]
MIDITLRAGNRRLHKYRYEKSHENREKGWERGALALAPSSHPFDHPDEYRQDRSRLDRHRDHRRDCGRACTVIEPDDFLTIAARVVDALSVTVVVATLAQWLPSVAALFTIAWTAIRIFETKTVQGWFGRTDE